MVTTRSRQLSNSSENRTLNHVLKQLENREKEKLHLQKVCHIGVIEDVESHIHFEYSVIHTVSLKSFQVKNNGEMTITKELVIFNVPVITHPELEHNFDLQGKVTDTKDYVHEQNLNGKHVESYYAQTTYDLIKTMIDFIHSNGKYLYGHNLLGDLIFLLSTQNFTGGPIAIKEKIKTEQSKGIIIPKWKDIICIDTLPTLSFFAPKTLKQYKGFCLKNKLASVFEKKDYPLKLSCVAKFAYNDVNIKQTHIAPDDTTFLFEVMKKIIEFDGVKSIISQSNRLGKFMPGRPILSDYICCSNSSNDE